MEASRPSARGETDSSMMIYERRPLKQVTLTPPDYKVHAQMLVESYIEKEVKFAGIVHNIPVHLDATNRTEVLRVIDRGKREKTVPFSLTADHDAILCLNAQNIKLSKRDGNEELLLRVPIHETAAVCYIRDDDTHIIGIKFGDPKQGSFSEDRVLGSEERNSDCKLAVLYCDSRGSAVEICSLIDQCFMYVYQDATMRYFDSNVQQGCGAMSFESSTLRSDKSGSSTPKHGLDHKNLGFFSQSSLDLDHGNGGTLSSMTTRSLPRTPTRSNSMARSESELSSTANEMIAKYMERLYTKLNSEELRKFAQIVKAWQNNLPTREFCERVFELYGPERKHLLIGMRPFIHDKDMNYFEDFLEHVGLTSASGTDTIGQNSSVSRVNRRTASMGSGYTSVTLPGDKYDQALNDIARDLDELGASVDVPTNPDMFLPKST